MNEERHRRASSGWVVSIALIVRSVLYVLSIGPAVWLRDKGYLGQDRLLAFYAPLIWIADKMPFGWQFLEAYARIWASPRTAN
jgi:hypothetical protein